MVTLPKMEMISTDSSWLAELPGIIQKKRQEEEFAGALADLQSNNPESIDKAIRRLGNAGPAGAALATRLIHGQQEAKQHADTMKIRQGLLGVAQGRLGIEREKTKREQDAIDAINKMTAPGAAPAAAPAAPPKYPGLEDDDDSNEGIDVSSQSKVPAAPASGIAGMTEEQVLSGMNNPGLPAATRQALALRFRQLQTEKRVNTNPDIFGKELEKKRGASMAKELDELQKQYTGADKELRNLDRAEQILKSGYAPTGFLGPTIAFGSKAIAGTGDALKSFGVEPPEMTKGAVDSARRRSSSYDELQALQSASVFDKLQGFGKSISDADRREISNIYASIGKSTEGNLAIINYLRRVAQIDKQEMEEVIKYRQHQKATGQQVDPDDIAKLRSKVRTRGGKELLELAAKDAEKYGQSSSLGDKGKRGGAEAGAAPAAAPAAAPKSKGTRPTPPPGLEAADWSESRQQWRMNGKFYDASGKEII